MSGKSALDMSELVVVGIVGEGLHTSWIILILIYTLHRG